jgi:hypothetical protein
MKLPSSISPLLLLALLGFIASPSHLKAQTVTWGATGLPPGMTVTNSGTNAVKISGTPTTPGSYNAIIFPKIGNVVGDMVSVPITVLPSGVSLPVYYGYTRLTTNGSTFNPLAGGSGYLFGNNSSSGYTSYPLFTTNGTTFTQAALPSGVNPLGYNTQAAIAGSRTLLCGIGAMAYSDNQGAFKSLAFPTGITDQWGGSSGIGGNGSNRFFYAYANNSWNGTNYSNSIQLFSMQNNQTNWTSRGSFNLPSNVTSFGTPSISVAVNGSVLVMAIQSYNTPGLLLTSINGGDTWTVNSSNPGIMSVAYGNGIFLGTGNGGVWKSTNGINWTQTSTTYVSNIIYSAPEGCFFSNDNGVSKDGIYWMQYGNWMGWNSNSGPASSGNGVIFSSTGQQLLTTYIPAFYASNPHLLNVGTATSFTLQLDSAGSGSLSQ